MHSSLQQLREIAKQTHPATVDFAQQIVRIPSMPGHEGDVAEVIQNKMTNLGYDDVWVDEVGNIIGKINGGSGPTVMLNGHMDHVDPGPIENWPYPPFDGKIVDGDLWGRASVDMKGPVACMIYAASLFKKLNITPPGDIYMTVPVMEEIGGLGTQHLVTHLGADAAICGEPSSNILRRAHRGRIELEVEFKGRSAHASVPHLGLNPHYSAAQFLAALSQIELGYNDTLGSSSVVPTLYSTDQVSPNVIPGLVSLTLDWRNVPGESPEQIVAKTQALLDATLAGMKGDYQAAVNVTTKDFTTYTGITQRLPSIFPSFILAEDDPFVQAAHTGLVDMLGREVELDIWPFATDGGHLMQADIPTVGFGPGNETLAHTSNERINLAQMEEALAGYVALILALAQAAEKRG